MASKNETIAEIGKEMRDEWAQVYFSEDSRRKDGEYCDDGFVAIEPEAVADRIEAANSREFAELKHWVKSAARWIKCHDIYHTSGDDLFQRISPSAYHAKFPDDPSDSPDYLNWHVPMLHTGELFQMVCKNPNHADEVSSFANPG